MGAPWEQYKSTEAAPPPAGPWSKYGGPSAPKEEPGYLSQVGTGLWNAAKGMVSIASEAGGAAVDPMGAIEHLKALKKMVLDPQVDQAIQAHDKWKAGDRSEAVGHAMAAVLPGVGPAAANIGDKLGSGDIKGAAADATVLGATMAAPHIAGPVARMATDTAGRAASAVGSGMGAVIDAAKSPLARDVLGVVSPRAAHAANVLNRGMSLAEKIKAAAAARNAPGPPTVDLPQGFSVAQGTTGSPAAARPAMGPQPAPIVPAASGALPGQFAPEPPALPPGFGVGGGTTSGPLPAAAPATPGYIPPVSGQMPRPPLASMTRQQIGQMTRAQIIEASQVPAQAPAAPMAPAPAVPAQAEPVAAPATTATALPAEAMPAADLQPLVAPPPELSMAQSEAAMARKTPAPTEAAGRSGFNPDGTPKSPQMRAAERINTNTGNKAQRWADALSGEGFTVEDVGNMTTADLEKVAAGLKAKGVLGPKESIPKTSLGLIKDKLRQMPAPEAPAPAARPTAPGGGMGAMRQYRTPAGRSVLDPEFNPARAGAR